MVATEKQLWQRLVDTLQNILQESIGLTEGCREVYDIGHTLELEDDVFTPSMAYYSDSDAFPLGNVRKLWAESGLKRMDHEREKVEAHNREWIMAAQNLLRYAKERL